MSDLAEFSSLLQFRQQFASFSLKKAQKRLEIERNNKVVKDSHMFAAVGSVFCDSRLPMGICMDDLNNNIVVAGWSNEVSVWNMQGVKVSSHQNHLDKVQCVNVLNGLILSGGFDNKIFISGPDPIKFDGHEGRVNSVKWLALNEYFVSCSHDMTWKLWSVEKRKCIQSQEGHGRGIYSLSVHPDQSLIASADLSGIAALWDLRTGKHIQTLKSHNKKILACEFAPNGYLLSTGSEDNTIKIWDIRKKSLMYTIPAHTKLISSLSLSQSSIVSGSYDGLVKVWKIQDFSLVQTLTHNSKVTDVCFDESGDILVSSSFDRTFKVWTAFRMN